MLLKQVENMAYWHENYRKPKYAIEKCGNFNGKVEFEGSMTGIPVVTIRVRHTNDTRLCNVTTSINGSFDGILHNDLFKARIYHNGKGAKTGHNSNDMLELTPRYKHLPCEWLRGVTTYDLLKIKQHILAIEPLPSGYSIVAADANKSNSVTTADIVVLRKLILGMYLNSVLPAFEQPWRFTPEFIPQDNSTAFNYNPFAMTIGGNYVGATYLEQDWEHTAPVSLTKRGFDAVKIGDVNSSWPDDDICDMEKGQLPDPDKVVLLVPSVSLEKEEEVKLQFKAGNFSDIVAFQMGLQFDSEQIGVLDVEDTNEELDKYEKEDYFGLTESEDGLVRTLWFDTTFTGKTLPVTDVVFSITIKAKEDVADLQSVISLDESVLPSKFWVMTREIVEAEDVSIEVSVVPKEERSMASIVTKTEPFRCFPNPFTNEVYLVFDHVFTPTEGRIQVFNIYGQIVLEKSTTIETGRNTIGISTLKDLNEGAYQATLIVENEQYTTRIVKK